ncbi:DUF2267 domain-containing protein [Fulvivirga ulvae]|uniref:DUF2267 domain-containing protein n=1 Tax=Fulvivirga ulvae TaxID=2904245 RepID=UPI001F16A1D2|nr:DUF2267 domain-containing protein [Fulvivirga ulvae]UII31792.1 DUF2267 domain-containing protein [Fulvivirga ulvae]
MSTVKFDKFAQEGNQFIHELSNELGHPQDEQQVLIVLRAVLHTIRDRITISESLDLISQLPMMLKALYVEQWKYQEKPNKFDTLEGLKNDIKQRQEKYGENRFDWELSTEDIFAKTIEKLSKYLDEGQLKHIEEQLPHEIKFLVTP